MSTFHEYACFYIDVYCPTIVPHNIVIIVRNNVYCRCFYPYEYNEVMDNSQNYKRIFLQRQCNFGKNKLVVQLPESA